MWRIKKIYKVCLAFHIKCTQYDESYRNFIPDTETQKFPSNNLKKHELISTSGFERISLSDVTIPYNNNVIGRTNHENNSIGRYFLNYKLQH